LLTFCRKKIPETGTIPDNALDLFASDIFLCYTFRKKNKTKRLVAALRIATSDLHPFSPPSTSTNLQLTMIYLFNKKGKVVPVVN
jgi:hypothetical protein